MNIRFWRSALLAPVLALSAVSAQAVEYTTIDPQASKIRFGYSQMGVGMEGSFAHLNVPSFSFDPANPDAAKIVIEVPMAGIDAGYDEANDELKKGDWLDSASHPLARFESTQTKALGDNRYEVTGTLAIKGKQQTITLPVTLAEEAGQGVLTGGFDFNRADFTIGEGQWRNFDIVANGITINFHVVARP